MPGPRPFLLSAPPCFHPFSCISPPRPPAPHLPTLAPLLLPGCSCFSSSRACSNLRPLPRVHPFILPGSQGFSGKVGDGDAQPPEGTARTSGGKPVGAQGSNGDGHRLLSICHVPASISGALPQQLINHRVTPAPCVLSPHLPTPRASKAAWQEFQGEGQEGEHQEDTSSSDTGCRVSLPSSQVSALRRVCPEEHWSPDSSLVPGHPRAFPTPSSRGGQPAAQRGRWSPLPTLPAGSAAISAPQ